MNESVPLRPEAEYKFRAESDADVAKFLLLIGEYNIGVSKVDLKQVHPYYGDVVVTLGVFSGPVYKPDISLDTMRRIVAQVADGHVILQSINTPDKYDGERYFHFYYPGEMYDFAVDRVSLPKLSEIDLVDFTEPRQAVSNG